MKQHIISLIIDAVMICIGTFVMPIIAALTETSTGIYIAIMALFLIIVSTPCALLHIYILISWNNCDYARLTLNFSRFTEFRSICPKKYDLSNEEYAKYENNNYLYCIYFKNTISYIRYWLLRLHRNSMSYIDEQPTDLEMYMNAVSRDIKNFNQKLTNSKSSKD